MAMFDHSSFDDFSNLISFQDHINLDDFCLSTKDCDRVVKQASGSSDTQFNSLDVFNPAEKNNQEGDNDVDTFIRSKAQSLNASIHNPVSIKDDENPGSVEGGSLLNSSGKRQLSGNISSGSAPKRRRGGSPVNSLGMPSYELGREKQMVKKTNSQSQSQQQQSPRSYTQTQTQSRDVQTQRKRDCQASDDNLNWIKIAPQKGNKNKSSQQQRSTSIGSKSDKSCGESRHYSREFIPGEHMFPSESCAPTADSLHRPFCGSTEFMDARAAISGAQSLPGPASFPAQQPIQGTSSLPGPSLSGHSSLPGPSSLPAPSISGHSPLPSTSRNFDIAEVQLKVLQEQVRQAQVQLEEISGTNQILHSLLNQMTSIINSPLTKNIEQYDDLKKMSQAGSEDSGTPVGQIMQLLIETLFNRSHLRQQFQRIVN